MVAQGIAFLRSALAEPDPGVVLGALGCLAKLTASELIGTVASLMTESQPERVLISASIWLGTTGDSNAVAPLAQLLRQRPRLFGLISGAPEDARLAAVRALSKLDLPAARSALWAVILSTTPATIICRPPPALDVEM